MFESRDGDNLDYCCLACFQEHGCQTANGKYNLICEDFLGLPFCISGRGKFIIVLTAIKSSVSLIPAGSGNVHEQMLVNKVLGCSIPQLGLWLCGYRQWSFTEDQCLVILSIDIRLTAETLAFKDRKLRL